jgi:hypothetical protein
VLLRKRENWASGNFDFSQAPEASSFILTPVNHDLSWKKNQSIFSSIGFLTVNDNDNDKFGFQEPGFFFFYFTKQFVTIKWGSNLHANFGITLLTIKCLTKKLLKNVPTSPAAPFLLFKKFGIEKVYWDFWYRKCLYFIGIERKLWGQFQKVLPQKKVTAELVSGEVNHEDGKIW